MNYIKLDIVSVNTSAYFKCSLRPAPTDRNGRGSSPSPKSPSCPVCLGKHSM